MEEYLDSWDHGLALIARALCRPVHEIEVQVFQLQLLERLQAVSPHILVVLVPELCGDEHI